MSDYDAAFGPMGSMTLAGLDVESVKNLQRGLNALGYGPLDVDGIIGPLTTKAAQAFWNERGPGGEVLFDSSLLNTVDKAAKGVSAGGNVKYEVPAGAAAVNAASGVVPFYKKPGFLFAAVAVAGVVGYVAWRANGSSLSGASATLSAADELVTERKKRRSKRDAAEKCGRTPDVDFDDGEELPPLTVASSHAVPVES